jgi:hypothetical protein
MSVMVRMLIFWVVTLCWRFEDGAVCLSQTLVFAEKSTWRNSSQQQRLGTVVACIVVAAVVFFMGAT